MYPITLDTNVNSYVMQRHGSAQGLFRVHAVRYLSSTLYIYTWVFWIFGNDTIVICPDTYACVLNCMIRIARPMFPDPAAYSVLLQFTLGLCPICQAHVWCHMSSWIIIWVIIRSVIDYGYIIYTLYSSNIVHLTWHRLQNLCHAKAWMHDYPKHPAIQYLTQPQSQSKLVL